MTVEDRHPTAANAAPRIEHAVLDLQTWQACRSELDEFMQGTRDRLQTLSQSLTNAVQGQRRQPAVQTAVPAEMNEWTAIDDDQSPNMAAGLPNQQACEPDSGFAESDFSDANPMARLDAIKRRLAMQVQQAS